MSGSVIFNQYKVSSGTSSYSKMGEDVASEKPILFLFVKDSSSVKFHLDVRDVFMFYLTVSNQTF